MSCVRGNVEEFYFVRWVAPEVSDADDIVGDVRELVGTTRSDLHYIAIIGDKLPPPSEEVRASMRRNIDELLEHCRTVHLVIEGRGFRRAMARSIGTSIFLLSKNRGRTFAQTSVLDALKEVGVSPERAAKISEAASAQGLLTPPQ